MDRPNNGSIGTHMDPQQIAARYRQERHQLIAIYSETITDLHATIAQQQRIIQAQQNELERLTATPDFARFQAAE